MSTEDCHCHWKDDNLDCEKIKISAISLGGHLFINGTVCRWATTNCQGSLSFALSKIRPSFPECCISFLSGLFRVLSAVLCHLFSSNKCDVRLSVSYLYRFADITVQNEAVVS